MFSISPNTSLVHSSVQFSRSVVSDSLRPHELQHDPFPSPTPGVHSDSRPSSQWCHPAMSSTAIPFFSYPHPSQHQSLYQWVNSSHEVAKVPSMSLAHTRLPISVYQKDKWIQGEQLRDLWHFLYFPLENIVFSIPLWDSKGSVVIEMILYILGSFGKKILF